MIFVNFKTYQEGTGEEAVKLAKICQAVSQKTSIQIILLVQTVDLFRLAQLGFEVWAQHVDDIEFGPHTGQTLLEAVVAAGVQGTLLNHSENRLPLPMVNSLVARCRKSGLKTLVCSDSVDEGQKIAGFKPDFLAYEPPEFIGSRTESVSTAKPEVIKEFVKVVKRIPILVGAGIHSRSDVQKSIELGAVGVLVATDVVLAKNPKKELLELASGFKKEGI